MNNQKDIGYHPAHVPYMRKVPAGAISGIALKMSHLAQDPHRLRFHYFPRAGGWLNDVYPYAPLCVP